MVLCISNQGFGPQYQQQGNNDVLQVKVLIHFKMLPIGLLCTQTDWMHKLFVCVHQGKTSYFDIQVICLPISANNQYDPIIITTVQFVVVTLSCVKQLFQALFILSFLLLPTSQYSQPMPGLTQLKTDMFPDHINPNACIEICL